MLDHQALSSILSNTKKTTKIVGNGQRSNASEYPIKALREILLNVLIYRDYSIHAENDSIRLIIFDDRIEVSNPGGPYGRLTLDEFGEGEIRYKKPLYRLHLRNPRNDRKRYSGIPP